MPLAVDYCADAQSRHARSASAGSQSAPSVSSDGVDDDEADEVPYAASQHQKEVIEPPPQKRPSPGGRLYVTSRTPYSEESRADAHDLYIVRQILISSD